MLSAQESFTFCLKWLAKGQHVTTLESSFMKKRRVRCRNQWIFLAALNLIWALEKWLAIPVEIFLHNLWDLQCRNFSAVSFLRWWCPVVENRIECESQTLAKLFWLLIANLRRPRTFCDWLVNFSQKQICTSRLKIKLTYKGARSIGAWTKIISLVLFYCFRLVARQVWRAQPTKQISSNG